MSNDVGLVLDSVVQAQPLVPEAGPGPRNGRLGIKVDCPGGPSAGYVTASQPTWAALGSWAVTCYAMLRPPPSGTGDCEPVSPYMQATCIAVIRSGLQECSPLIARSSRPAHFPL